MARFQKRKLSKKETSAQKRQADLVDPNAVSESTEPKVVVKKTVAIPKVVSVKELAEITNLPVTTVIGALMKNGVLANINENVDLETAQIIGDDLGFEIVEKIEDTNIVKEVKEVSISKSLVPRPPVVAIMGHVDHGKTSLLDKIRATDVAAGESGGITQHITAFQVNVNHGKVKNRLITFIDTPGHAAFTTMRSHGTAITDIVVLIVAADDGVMPQTIEVIEQAKSNNVPIIVAINKVDKPGADPMKAKQQLLEHGLNPEEWGGDTVVVEVSAKTGKGIEELLESLALFADLKEYKADPTEDASGVVIESRMRKGSGPLAVVLVENGTLKPGQTVVIGGNYGKIRMLEDTLGKKITQALPSTPVRIAGLNGLPTFGDRLQVVGSEKEARNEALKHHQVQTHDFVSAKKIVSEENATQLEFNIIIKADVQGSLEAIKQSLNSISHPEIKVKIVHEGIGAVSESDVNMAKATGAVVLAFRVQVLALSKRIAELEKVKISSYEVIYDLIDAVKAEMSEALPPEVLEIETGKLKVLAIFRYDKKKTIFGGMVEEGEIKRSDKIRVLRGEKEIYVGQVEVLKQGKEEAPVAVSGSECGISVSGPVDVMENDTVVAFHTEERDKVVN